LETINAETKKISQDALPMVTFDKDLTFHFNNEKIYIFHVPNAHADGDAMVYFTKNNVLQTGDIFFNGKYPFIDLAHGGSVKGCIQGLEKALKTINEDTRIIPVRGDVATYLDVRNTIIMLRNIYKRVTVEYMKKKSEDEVAKMTDLTSNYDTEGYGDGFISTESFLRTIYKQVGIDRKPEEERVKKNEEARKKIEEIKRKRETEGKR
jgi:glyoxylase-like metal-dependent hydrolase (beta-lactamase superfamily II)